MCGTGLSFCVAQGRAWLLLSDVRECVIGSRAHLSESEQHAAELHSIMNILNILVGELSLLSTMPHDPNAALGSLAEDLDGIVESLRDSQPPKQVLSRLDVLAVPLLRELHGLELAVSACDAKSEIAESRANIVSMLRVLRQRIVDYELESEFRDCWLEIPIALFRERFIQVFRAISVNSKGRFGISFNRANCRERDYYIDISLDSELGSHLWLPVQFEAVVRDLVANARKYTDPGGHLSLAIHQSSEQLSVQVEDDGIGIPAGELDRVADFGYRASNVRERMSYGGGVGLSKAVWLIQQWGGDVRIASELGRGTRVCFEIPNASPTRACQSMPCNWSI